MDPATREEALEELARLERRLARREKRAKRREEKKLLVAKANQEWQIETTSKDQQSQERDLFEGMECSNDHHQEASQDLFASSFILASQLPMLDERDTQSVKTRRQYSSGSYSKGRARGVSFKRGALYGMRERNVNSLPELESVEDFPPGWSFRMPQPDSDKILRTTHFSLPREYTRFLNSPTNPI